MSLTVPVGFSAARIATIGPHPIIKFRNCILPILRKSLSRAVQVIRQPITTFDLAPLHLPARGFSAAYPPTNLVPPANPQAIHHLIGSNTLCDNVCVGSIWRNRTLSVIDLA
jgi:hypothetical protein